MQKSNTSLLSLLFIIVVLVVSFYVTTPHYNAAEEIPSTEFSTKRALAKVKAMTNEPHYVGSAQHQTVVNYLRNELQTLGLQPEIQEGFTLSDGGTLVQSKNIMARIKGTASAKALVLLSHYDSAPHSKSLGASDDASGIATILESVRAFQAQKQKPKNDIILLFTDAEELGLNGAALFVTQHQWAKEVGLVINFEARGSSGPGYMLMETNKGNSEMVNAFSASGISYPVSNSLMYSIYKMLPNDTDLTVFREQGKIQGFNFAFIDNHFNYHTAQDNYDNLDRNSLAHQGANLFPLLIHFANADLSNFTSDKDKVYFTIPFTFLSYPFEWIFPMLIVTGLLLFLFVFIGISKKILHLSEIGKGVVTLLTTVIVSGGIAFFGWKLIQFFYPQYKDILQGFTYNGHDYIYGFVSLTLAICFWFYHASTPKRLVYDQLVAPLFLWFLLNAVIAYQLKGAAFLIIPLVFSVLLLGYYVFTQKDHWIINLVFSIPTLFILPPFIVMFPIGLGLKILAGSAVLNVLTFVLLLPVFGSFVKKKKWGGLFLILAFAFFLKAHQNADYDKTKPKPNSLVYVLQADSQKAYWATYDANLDEWTKSYLGENPDTATVLNKNKVYSKYNSGYTFMAKAPLKNIAKPIIEFVKDSTVGSKRYLKVIITPQRNVNRYAIFSNGTSVENLVANGVKTIDFESKISGKGQSRLLNYYVVNNYPLTMEFSIPSSQKLDLELKESSFDLLESPQFSIPKRKEWMMPTPFVLNDAIILEQKMNPTPKNRNLEVVNKERNANEVR